MKNSNQRKTGAILSYVSIGINLLIQLLYTPFLIAKMGQSEYGLYSLIASIIGYLTVLDLGFGNAIIVYTSKYKVQNKIEEEKKLHGMFKLVFIILGIIVGIIGIILFFNVNNLFGNTMTSVELYKAKIMMLIVSFNLFLTFVFNIYSSIITAYEKFTYQKLIAILGNILKPLIMIPFLLMGFKSVTMCCVLTIVNIIIVLSNYIFCKKKLKINIKYSGFDKSVFGTVLSYSIWIFLAAIVDKANWSVDNFILGAVSGTVAVSIYSVAATINNLFISLSTAISGVLLPKVSKMVAQNATREDLTNEMIKVGRIQYYVIFLICSGFVLFGKQFLLLWVGKGFEESYYVTLFLTVPLCIPLIQNLGISIMQAMNKFRFKSITTFVMAIANIIISIFLTKKLGAIGAAIGTCISLIICNIIIMNIYYHKELKLNMFKFWGSIIKQSISFIIPISIILIVLKYISLHGWLGFIIYVSVYSLIYSITAYLLSMNNYEKEFINNILTKFHLRKVNYARNSK